MQKASLRKSGLCDISCARYSEKCFTQTLGAGVSLKGTDVVAENQQKHLSLSFATKA